MKVFAKQHAWHLVGLASEVTDVYAQKHCRLADRSVLTSEPKKFVLRDFGGVEWIFMGRYIKQGETIFTQRGFVVEKVDGSRPDS